MTYDELKAYYPYTNRDGFYHKSEADKVIAELRAQIVQADSECADALKQLKELEKLNARLRHQKHKRCLAIAKLCGYAYATEERDGFWLKWWKRWIELAKNF